MERKITITIYAEDFREDIWEEEYCGKLGVDSSAKSITLTVTEVVEYY